MIDKKDVLHIAALARLTLSEEEVEGMTKQLDSILGYIDLLNSADTSGVEASAHMKYDHNPLREDATKESLPHDELLRNGPSVRKGHFAVPKVIG
ncbi:MAG: Asp-tRNA(Asn)/Glu-tRNA(Gln) amidotransferase subunit GatC [Chitinispirillaceae bacterium]|nr:Asp-tRNA(Asn)/Glu-tRNA(Gln) amidotransferase subunit GatC [Chitinispirillaceae bacterium]